MQYMEEEIMEIRFEERKQLKEKTDQSILVFGKYMTDYMFCYGLEQKKDGTMPEGTTGTN